MALAWLAVIPLPILLFYQLRGLARRARSAHLAEHCAIVGIGGSCALLLPWVTILFASSYVNRRPGVEMILLLIFGVTALLFLLWAIYLLVRFAIAFHSAARQLRHKWRQDDHAGVI